MPIHDWTRVYDGIFHAFHHSWIEEISRALNRGLLPSAYYALQEQRAGGLEPDVLTLQWPGSNGKHTPPGSESSGTVALATAPPRVWLHAKTEADTFADKKKGVVIRHVSDHRIVAMVEIVSPGNKSGRPGLKKFVEKVKELLDAGVHLLILDLLPPSPRDPQGIHKEIWDQFEEIDFALPSDRPLMEVAYLAGSPCEAFVEPTAVGRELSEMPLFLTRHEYVNVPLEATYAAAYQEMAQYWRNVLEGKPN